MLESCSFQAGCDVWVGTQLAPCPHLCSEWLSPPQSPSLQGVVVCVSYRVPHPTGYHGKLTRGISYALFITSVCLSMYLGWGIMPQCTYRSQRAICESKFFPLAMRVLETEFKSAGLVAGKLTFWDICTAPTKDSQTASGSPQEGKEETDENIANKTKNETARVGTLVLKVTLNTVKDRHEQRRLREHEPATHAWRKSRQLSEMGSLRGKVCKAMSDVALKENMHG